eukprot:SAG22_NODE_9272_length_599_cov_1.034000_1_plen_51_part_10
MSAPIYPPTEACPCQEYLPGGFLYSNLHQKPSLQRFEEEVKESGEKVLLIL